MSQETYDSAREGMLAGVSLVAENTDQDWADKALHVIRAVCLRSADFICDDIWDAGLPSTVNDKALGPVLMRAKRLGYCMRTDRVRPSVRSHLSGKPVWVSLLYGCGE